MKKLVGRRWLADCFFWIWVSKTQCRLSSASPPACSCFFFWIWNLERHRFGLAVRRRWLAGSYVLGLRCVNKHRFGSAVHRRQRVCSFLFGFGCQKRFEERMLQCRWDLLGCVLRDSALSSKTVLPSSPSPFCERARLPQAQHRRALLQIMGGDGGTGWCEVGPRHALLPLEEPLITVHSAKKDQRAVVHILVCFDLWCWIVLLQLRKK